MKSKKNLYIRLLILFLDSSTTNCTLFLNEQFLNFFQMAENVRKQLFEKSTIWRPKTLEILLPEINGFASFIY